MKVAIGADHAGFELKEELKSFLEKKAVSLTDVGTYSLDSVDYPLYAEKVAQLVADGSCDFGILVCGSGMGMAIVANKIAGIRAVTCFDAYSAKLSREHNDANVLALGSRLIDYSHAKEIAYLWLNTKFLGGRHARRVQEIDGVEKKYLKNKPKQAKK